MCVDSLPCNHNKQRTPFHIHPSFFPKKALAIFIGIDLERAHAPPEAMNVMVAWGIYHILALVAMETLPRPLSKLYNVVAEKTVRK